MGTATHEDSDGTGYCRGCGTTIGESHHVDCDVLEARRLKADEARPDKCSCGHSRAAHDSGYAFCWFCKCDKFETPNTAVHRRGPESNE